MENDMSALWMISDLPWPFHLCMIYCEKSRHGWMVVWNMTLFSHILGSSSSQLTFLFFRGVGFNHQPDGNFHGHFG